MQTKKELRTQMRAKRYTIENKSEKSKLITELAKSLDQVKKADSLFIFYPLDGEVDLLALLDFASEQGKKIAFPKCLDRDGNMDFFYVDSLDALEEGSFMTREPKEGSTKAIPSNAVIFLPALSIDENGYRLGYGKGYYDRYLEKYAHLAPFTAGVIFDELISKELPHDEYDIPCSVAISENGITYFPQALEKTQEA